MLRALCVAALALAAAAPAAAQVERWQVTIEPEEYVWDVRLVRLAGDSLVVRQSDTLRAIPVEQITELRLIRSSEVRLGEGSAGAMSALTGSDDEVYDFRPLEFAERMRAIQEILRDRPTEP